MPTDRRSKREKLRDAKRLARALESDEARNARRARDRLSRSRARERTRAERLACIYNMLAEGNMAEDNDDRQQWMQESNCHDDSDEAQDEFLGEDGESHEDMSDMHQTTFADADTPKDRRTKRERMRDAKRRARAAESDEARNARRARDRASHRRARERMRAERQA